MALHEVNSEPAFDLPQYPMPCPVHAPRCPAQDRVSQWVYPHLLPMAYLRAVRLVKNMPERFLLHELMPKGTVEPPPEVKVWDTLPHTVPRSPGRLGTLFPHTPSLHRLVCACSTPRVSCVAPRQGSRGGSFFGCSCSAGIVSSRRPAFTSLPWSMVTSKASPRMSSASVLLRTAFACTDNRWSGEGMALHLSPGRVTRGSNIGLKCKATGEGGYRTATITGLP